MKKQKNVSTKQKNVYTKQKKPTLIIYKKKFIDWAFDDYLIISIGNDLVNELIRKGEVNYNLRQLLCHIGYLPFAIIKNKEVLFEGKKYIDILDDTDIDNPEDYNLVFDDEVEKVNMTKIK
jgi:hypothetical protein